MSAHRHPPSNNPEIIRMLLDKGASAAMPTQVNETPLHLAVRHGNRPVNDLLTRHHQHQASQAHLHGSQSISRPHSLMALHNSTTANHTTSYHQHHNSAPANNNNNNTLQDTGPPYGAHGADPLFDRKALDDILGLNTFQLPPDPNFSQSIHQMNYVRSLADMLACPHTGFPLSVGLLSRVSTGARGTYLHKLAEELGSLTVSNEPVRLRISPLLGVFPVVVSFLIGYIFGLAIAWQVGMALGLAALFIQFLGIALVLFGTYSQEWPKAITTGSSISKFLDSLRLLLNVLFCYPMQEKMLSRPVTILFTHHNLSGYQTSSHGLISIVEKIWQVTEKQYNNFVTRIFCRQNDQPGSQKEHRFRNLCCLPGFVVVICVFLALLTIFIMLKVNETNLGAMFSDKGLLTLFILMIGVVVIGLLSSIPVLLRMIKCLLRTPSMRLREMLESVSMDTDVVTQTTKTEFQRACSLLNTFDRYLGNRQTRVIVCVDATDTFNRETLTRFVHQVHTLLLCEPTAPIAVILAADFQVFMGDLPTDNPAEGLSDSFHLVHSAFHLPIYMEEPCFSMKLPLASHQQVLQSFDSISTAVSGMRTAYHPVNNSSSKNLVGNSVPTPLLDTMDSTGYTIKPSISWNGPNAPRTITELYVGCNDMSEMNARIIKNLVAATAFTGRLLRINQLEFKIEDLVVWLTFVLHWPYHAAWLVLYIEEQYDRLDPRVTLGQVYHRLLAKITRCQESQLKVLACDDRDVARLDIFVKREAGRALTVGELRPLIACSAFMSPYLRHCIRDIIKHKSTSTPKTPKKDESINDTVDCASPLSGKQSLTWPRPASSTDMPKTPSTIRKCLVKLKDGYPGKNLSQLTIEEVWDMLSQIEGISDIRLEDYKARLKELNITGLVLSVCDMDQLRPELGMTFGDWQLFHTLILHLRSVEAMHEEAGALGGSIVSPGGIPEDLAGTMVGPGEVDSGAEEITKLASALCSQLTIKTGENKKSSRGQSGGLNDSSGELITGDDTEDALEDGDENADDDIWKRKQRNRRSGDGSTKSNKTALLRQESEDSALGECSSSAAFLLAQQPPQPQIITAANPLATLSAYQPFPRHQFVSTHMQTSVFSTSGPLPPFDLAPCDTDNPHNIIATSSFRKPHSREPHYLVQQQPYYGSATAYSYQPKTSQAYQNPGDSGSFRPYKETTMGPETITTTHIPHPQHQRRSQTLPTSNAITAPDTKHGSRSSTIDASFINPRSSHQESRSNGASRSAHLKKSKSSGAVPRPAHPRCSQHSATNMGETVALLVTEKRAVVSKRGDCPEDGEMSGGKRRRKLKLVRSLSHSRERVHPPSTALECSVGEKTVRRNYGSKSGQNSSRGKSPSSGGDSEYRRYIPVFYEQEGEGERDDWNSDIDDELVGEMLDDRDGELMIDCYYQDDDDHNDCTCEYWYRLEREGKMAISAPTSQVNSRPITSPELSDGEGGSRRHNKKPDGTSNSKPRSHQHQHTQFQSHQHHSSHHQGSHHKKEKPLSSRTTVVEAVSGQHRTAGPHKTSGGGNIITSPRPNSDYGGDEEDGSCQV